METVDSREMLGLKYGYPKCCVEHFIETFGEDKRTNLPLDGTGYKPCPKCVTKSEEELIETISKNRDYPYEFPITDDNYDMKLIYSFIQDIEYNID
jgi:hypothetical protein